jgi:hypothetical protein
MRHGWYYPYGVAAAAGGADLERVRSTPIMHIQYTGPKSARQLCLTTILAAALLSACGAPAATISYAESLGTATPTASAAALARIQAPVEPRATPQATATVTSYGPVAERFAPNINPLSGLPVPDPELLKIPAVLVSISHFPPTGRPQSGLSFAPFVYEFSITGGETRFLTAFHGEWPAPETPITGPCTVRTGAFEPTAAVIGNRVWMDANANGTQDLSEGGIPGICVNLRGASGQIVDSTTTDTNGMYGFNAEAGGSYRLEFEAPEGMEFAPWDLGNEDSDSDANPADGMTEPFEAVHGSLDLDAGMQPNAELESATQGAAVLPKAEVGPVRSGRLLYAYLGRAYTNSCLIYAFASPEILGKLPHCAFVSHEDANGGEMISLERMRRVAEDNMRHTASRAFDYSSNLYSEVPSPGGFPGSRLDVFFGNINQSAWVYDPLYKSYLRYVDTADPSAKGALHPEVDRLTGRQLHFENVVVIMADVEVVSRSNLDIHLDPGNDGPAKLYRNGQQFSITWSTHGGEYEDRTGLLKPIRFLNPDGSPTALKPGHTWVIIVTPFSLFEPQGAGAYLVKYEPPAGEAR